jgi:nicotinamide mononucleotide transporter
MAGSHQAQEREDHAARPRPDEGRDRRQDADHRQAPLGALLAAVTDSDVPYLDALPTVGSLAGQWLLARKWLENWPTWVAVNLFSIGLFAFKGLWLTVALYAAFALMALWGWRAWTALAARAPGPAAAHG